MQLTINGDVQDVPEGLDIRGLIDHLGLSQRRVAVEVNKQLVRRADHAGHRLQPDDRVEIVTLVGGG